MRKRNSLAMIAMACGIVGFTTIGCQYDEMYDGAPEENVEQISSEFEPISPADGTLPTAADAAPTQVIALSQPATETMNWLSVSSPSFHHAQAIPDRFTAFGKGALPELKWSDVPRGTKSFAVIVEDPDALHPRPYVHLILYNIPGTQAGISQKDLEYAQSSNAGGTALGRNSAGTLGYVAPMPPSGEGAHTYHFQVFALDSALGLPAGAQKQAVLDAMQGRVLAKGETIGTFKR